MYILVLGGKRRLKKRVLGVVPILVGDLKLGIADSLYSRNLVLGGLDGLLLFLSPHFQLDVV